MSPVVAEAAAGTGVVVVDLQVDTEPERTAALDIRSVPTLIGLRDGVEVGRIVGLQPRQTIDELFARVATGAGPVSTRVHGSLLVARGGAGLALVGAGLALDTVVLIVIGAVLSLWACLGLLRSR